MTARLYEVLRVEETADGTAIKRAYFRLVRQFPPDTEPEKFKQIRQAYDTLSDEKARQNYDAQSKYGDRLKNLFAAAEKELEAEDWEAAARSFKRIIIMNPQEHSARNSLALCYAHMETFEKAIGVLNDLLKDVQDVPLYWKNRAMIQMAWWETKEHGGDSGKILELVREDLAQAIALEAFNQEPYRLIATTYMKEKRYGEAEQWLEKAISADGKLDLSDLDLLFTLSEVYLLSGQVNRIESVVNRISGFVPDSEEARGYVAFRFGKIAEELWDVKAFRVAHEFLKAACHFGSDEHLVNWRQLADTVSHAEQEFDTLRNDARIPNGLIRAAAIFYLDATGQYEESQTQRKATFDNILQELCQYTGASIVNAVNILKNDHRHLYKLNTNYFDSIQEAFANLVKKQQQESSGGCFVVTASFADHDAFLIDDFRRFRDERLCRYKVGRAFIRFYRHAGPRAAALIRARPLLKRWSRRMLYGIHRRLGLGNEMSLPSRSISVRSLPADMTSVEDGEAV